MERCCKSCEWLGEDKEHYICYRDLMAGIYRKEDLDIEKSHADIERLEEEANLEKGITTIERLAEMPAEKIL